MFKNKNCIIIIGLILLASTAAVFGQSNRTYVAESGSDSNLCTTAAPCRTVFKALSVVNPGGEVVITENGDYENFFVGKSVTVGAAPGVNAKITVAGGNGIWVGGAQSTDTVTIRNLHLTGPGAGTGSVTAIGIYNSSAGTIFIDNCILTDFSNAISSSAAGQAFITNTTVRNSLFGIGIQAPIAEGTVRATIDNCLIEMNDTGISFTSKVTGTIRNTIAANNSSRAVLLRSTIANMRTEAMIENCQFNSNTVGLLVTGTLGVSVARLSRTTINNSRLSGISMAAPNIVYTLQNNVFTGNFPDVSGTLTPLSLQ